MSGPIASPSGARGRSRKLQVCAPRRTPLIVDVAANAIRGIVRPASVSFPNSRRVSMASLIEGECVERVAGGDQDLLAAVDHVRFRRVRHLTDMRVPDWVAVGRIERDEITGNSAAEQQFP